MSRIGDLQDFLDAVGPHQPVPGHALPAAAPPPAPAAAPVEPELELELESLPVTTGLEAAGTASPPVELDAVTAVTRFPPR